MKNLIAKAETAARKLYEYDSSYPEERRQAMDEWNDLYFTMRREGIDWKAILPRRNHVGEKLW